MADFSQALDWLDREEVKLEGLRVVRDAVREMQSAQGNLSALQAQAAQVTAARDAALADLKDAKQGITDAKAAADALVAGATTQAQGIVEQAQHNAQDIAAKAAKDAAQAVADAKAAAEKDLAGVTKTRDGISAEIVALNAAKAEALDARDAVAGELAEKSAALETVKAAIAALRG